MTDIERLDERLTAVERAVVDGDHELDQLTDLAAFADDLERVESRLDDIEERLATVEARSQSVEGFVGRVRTVNEDVEQQADAAIAAVDRLERRVGELEALTEGTARTGDAGNRPGGAETNSRGLTGPENPEQSVDRVVTGRATDRGRAPVENGTGRDSHRAGTGTRGQGAAGDGRAAEDGSGAADADTTTEQGSLDDDFDLEGEQADEDDGILTSLRSKFS